MNLTSLSLVEFVQEVASSSPAPGGGSVAANAGAQGFALLTMVCRLTLGREKYKDVWEEILELLTVVEEKEKMLLEYVDRDTEGFKAVMDAFSLPNNSEEERNRRREAIENATIVAAEIPLQTAKLCLAGLNLVPGLLLKGNANALSDMGVAALLLKAGLDGALYNVRINAISLKSKEKREALLDECRFLTEEGATVAESIHRTVLVKLESGK